MTPPPAVVLSGHFDRDHERRYVHLPFTVPPRVGQLHLRYAYSDRIAADPGLAGGNTLDLGLFDERGTAAGGPGFRGWSGSAQDAVTIAETWATPPYRAGAIGAGVWHVLLGPYKVGPRGLDYRVGVRFDLDLPAPEPPPAPIPAVAPSLPPPAEPGWLRCDLHCHTRYSDGDSWPAEVGAAAATAGLDVLAITDHNSAHVAAGRPAGDRPLLLPGVEVTTYGGHWNVWGTDRWHEFRVPSREATAAAMRAAAAAGGFVSVNHPKPFGPAWEYGDGLAYHAIEVWNGRWEWLNAVALAHWEAHLRRGERVVAIGGSDTHRLRPPESVSPAVPRLGHPTTWIRVDVSPSPTTVLEALRRGRCFVSATPAGPQLYLAGEGAVARVRVLGARGSVLVLASDAGCVAAGPITADDRQESEPIPPNAAYVRAQVLDAAGNVLALSNPLWRSDAGGWA